MLAMLTKEQRDEFFKSDRGDTALFDLCEAIDYQMVKKGYEPHNQSVAYHEDKYFLRGVRKVYNEEKGEMEEVMLVLENEPLTPIIENWVKEGMTYAAEQVVKKWADEGVKVKPFGSGWVHYEE